MEKCKAKDLLYNSQTKRCYKSCEQKNKETHPVTKKCRKKCKNEKNRRLSDFRCVKNATQKQRRAVALKANSKPLAVESKPLAVESKPRDTEALIPPPLQKSLDKNLHFLQEWIEKGKGKRIEFAAEVEVSDVIAVYFYEKYKQECPMFPIKTYIELDRAEVKNLYERKIKHEKKISLEEYKEQLLKKYKRDYSKWNVNKFLKNLKLCLETGEQIIMIPLCIPRHFNMLIMKVATREIIRFEPHGSFYNDYTENTNVNKFLEKLTEQINEHFNLTDQTKRFKYVSPQKSCPSYTKKRPLDIYEGFQMTENKVMTMNEDEGEGFCLLWSWFFSECVINNPQMPVDEVYLEAQDILRTDEMNFATVIRGYFYSINEELVKMHKAHSIKSDYINSIKSKDNFFLDYLKASSEKLRAKPQKPFIGGIKNASIEPANIQPASIEPANIQPASIEHTFIMPRPHPKAMRVVL